MKNKEILVTINKLKSLRNKYIKEMNEAKLNNDESKKIIYLRLIIHLDSLISELVLKTKDDNPMLFNYLIENIDLGNISDELKEYAIKYSLEKNIYIRNDIFYARNH